MTSCSWWGGPSCERVDEFSSRRSHFPFLRLFPSAERYCFRVYERVFWAYSTWMVVGG